MGSALVTQATFYLLSVVVMHLRYTDERSAVQRW